MTDSEEVLRRGDLLVTPDVLPLVNRIVSHSFEGELRFEAWALDDYLRFLEFAVFHERIILGSGEFESPLSAELDNTSVLNDLTQRWVPTGLLRLEDQLHEQLQSSGVLASANLTVHDFSPRELFDRYLENAEHLQDRVRETERDLRGLRLRSPLRREMAALSLALEVGPSLYTAAAAREAQLPYAISEWEAAAINPVEAVEATLGAGIASRLHQTLNAGILSELQRLAAFGATTPYPSTPVASQIVSESNSPEDLCRIALQLRREYAAFRKVAAQLDAELLNPDTTTRRKLKIRREVETMASALWPEQKPVFRKEALDLACVIPLLPVATSSAGATKLAITALDKPVDVLLSWFRKRRVRLLLRSKRRWLASADLQRKLTSIFGIPLTVVKNGVRELREQRGA